MSTKTVSFAFPEEVGREVVRAAKEEKRTVTELVREAVRQYRAVRTFQEIAAEGRALAKKKGLTEKDFGGPFAK